jgi:hypothetical protein
MAYLLGVNRSNYVQAELQWRELPKTSRADYLAILEALESNEFNVAANNSKTQNEQLQKFVNKLSKETERLNRQIRTAEKRLDHYIYTYQMLNKAVVSFEALMISNTGKYSDDLVKRLNLKHGRTLIQLENVVIQNIYKKMAAISIYKSKLSLINSIVNNPLGLYKTV